MEVDARKLQDDPTSHCWSFGSINHPSSQSRKISVGIMVDSLQKKSGEASKEGDIAELNAERVNPDARKSAKGKSKIEVMQTEAVEPVNSPWVTTRTFYPKETTLETLLCPEQISDLPASERQRKHNRAKNAAITHSVHLFTNNTSILSDGDTQKKFNGVTYERKGRRDGSTERVPDFTFATVPDVLKSSEKGMEDKMNTTENGKTESLRLKLQEILGTVSSPNDHFPESPSRELGANCINPEQTFIEVGDAVVKHRQSSKNREQTLDKIGDTLSKPRQNSDTIETDSDCPDHGVRRPVTRSFTRKRAPTKAQKKTEKNAQLSGYKQKHQGKNINSCEDGLPRRLRTTFGGISSLFTQKKNEKHNSRTESLSFLHKRDVTDKIQEVTHRSETPVTVQKTSSLGKIRDYYGFKPGKESDYLGVEKNISRSNSHNSPLTNNTDNQYGNFDSPEYREQQKGIGTASMGHQENIGGPSVRNFVTLPDELQSPTLGINTPISRSSLSSMPKPDKMGDIRGLTALQSSKFDCYDDVRIESSVSLDDAEELRGFPTRKASTEVEGKYEAHLSESSSDDMHSGSSVEGSPANDKYDRIRCGGRNTLFEETRTAKKLKFMFRPAEKLSSLETPVQLNDINTRSPSVKEKEESNLIPEPENDQVDGLARAIELFALKLEKLKSKINLVTGKKSSEILMSVAEDIHVRLQNVESQIQTDMGKLKNVSTLKRKRMETRFGEQEEQLQSIYEKFKEQINQHLLDCRSTFEGLEADQLEFKGTIEKRKTSHQKLLLQAEEAIETLLNDAQRRITATHEAIWAGEDASVETDCSFVFERGYSMLT
ncbi:asynaptic protein [Parasponia andersonii]|uniref:Asynaptic protein n=1 Tax=Parasponia andersonii TaxID=3476 RepID=A0A2P5B385_PARAD|nr:asynaptic protein [Parasponia andersonii]